MRVARSPECASGTTDILLQHIILLCIFVIYLSQIKVLLSYIKRIFLVSSKMALFLAIINDITATSGLKPRFHVAAESQLAVGPIGRCSRA